jgi:biotin carboxyl carrier protein
MKENMKSRAVKLFGIFLGAMLIMTIVSRMIVTQKMPVVTTTGIKSESIAHRVEVGGTIEAEKQTPVFIAEGLRVSEVYVKQGSRIGKGAHLLRLDEDYLASVTADAEKELEEFMEKGDAYADGDRTPVFTESGLRVSQVCVKKGDSVYAGQPLIRLDTDYLYRKISDMEGELDSQRLTRDGMYEAEDSRSADALSKQIDEKQRELDRYNSIWDNGGTVYSSCGGVVTDILIKAGDITMEQAVALVSSSPELSGEAERLRRRIDALKKAAEHMGYINSPAGGIITEAALRAGDLTADGAAFIISDESSGKVFTGIVPDEEVEYLKVGGQGEHLRRRQCKGEGSEDKSHDPKGRRRMQDRGACGERRYKAWRHGRAGDHKAFRRAVRLPAL